MVIVQLLASGMFGGPERQVLGLAQSLPASYQSVFLSFEKDRCRPFLDRVRHSGREAVALEHDHPHVLSVIRELVGHLRSVRADVLCCAGYKADLYGWLAARRVGIPVVAVSHGWTAANFKARVNETLDRWWLRWLDRVVCVS